MIGEIKTDEGEWDARFFRLAEWAQSCSKDPVRKVGAAVVTPDRRQYSTGYNGFPRGTPDVKAHLMDDEIRQQLMVHAEQNAVANSPFDVAGCTLYATKFPCHRCAAVIANAQIVRVVSPPPDLGHRTWGQSYSLALEILSNAGIEVLTLPFPAAPGGE